MMDDLEVDHAWFTPIQVNYTNLGRFESIQVDLHRLRSI